MNHETSQRAPHRRRFSVTLATLAALLGAPIASAEIEDPSLQVTPARLGLVEGDVAFWRPGGEEWEAATVNIPLATGDALASRDGRFEIQIGPQSFVRGADATQVRVKSQEPDFLQLEVSQGSVVLDLRRLPVGHLVAIESPQGAMTADRDGYYRVDVDAESMRVIVRRAGVATLTPAGGQPLRVATGESVAVRGAPQAQFALAAAPGFDEWDRWNYARADSFLAAPSTAVVSSDVYGVAELDRYGSWREVPTYGRVWAPAAVPVGWAPYTTGRWLMDPFYGWSWVDYSPWGWAPFHYGRWVHVGYWAWAPGPVLVRPVYAPALVAFFTPSVSIGVGFGVPFVSWVALGWGEPLLPWWGGVGFIGSPCWWGWGGPRVINNIVINNGDTVYGGQINVYRNTKHPGGLVGVPKDHFGGDVARVRLRAVNDGDVKPWRGGALPVAKGGGRGIDAPPARPKGALPDLRGARQAAAQFAPRGATTAFARGGAAGTSGYDRAAPPPKARIGEAYDRLGDRRTGTGAAEAAKPGGSPAYDRLRNQLRGADTAAAAKGGEPPPFDRLRGQTRRADAARATAPKAAADRPPFERLRGQARTGDSAAAAPKAAGASPPYDRLRGQVRRGDSSARQTAGGAAPPPLRGLAKPQDGSASAYRRMQEVASNRPASGAPQVAAPSQFQRAETAPAALSGGSTWNKGAAPAVPDVRSVARSYERAPSVQVAPQPKMGSMPNLGGGGSLSRGAMGGGMPSGGGGGMGGGASRGGGGRPNLSR